MARPAEPCELTASIVVDRPIQACWDIYTDNTLVSQWAPAVHRVECSAAVLAKNVVRTNHVTVDGKSGHTVEQCTQLIPLKRVDIAVTEETFGFSHMLTSYGFSVTFDVDGDRSLMVMETQYTPKKIFASVMTAQATQRQLFSLMSDTLEGFKHYAENC